MTSVAVVAPLASPAPASGTRQLNRLGDLRRWLFATGGHGAWILIWTVIGIGATVFSPLLAGHSLLLMVLAPRTLFLAMAADSVGLVLFVVAGTIRLAITDGSYFILGRRLQHVPRRLAAGSAGQAKRRSWFVRYSDSLCRWLCNHGLKAGTVLFFRPNAKYLAVAGAYGVSARVAGWSSVLGTVTYLTFMHIGVGLLF